MNLKNVSEFKKRPLFSEFENIELEKLFVIF